MKEGKDIAGLSVPFAAGISIGEFLFFPLIHRTCGPEASYYFAAASFFLTAIYLLFLIIKRPRAFVFYAGLFLAAGFLCSANRGVTGGVKDKDGFLVQEAERQAARLKSIIDAIPYSSESTAGVVKALTTGDRSGLGRETAGIFRKAGGAHLLALSGLHLGIIYLLLLWATAVLGRSPAARLLKFLLIVGISGYYSIATGRSPSIMRAFYFILINEISKLLSRKQEPVRVLCSALMLQLSLESSIIRNTGFQLSYLAMTGISTLYPILSSWYPSDGKGDRFNLTLKLWKLTALSLSCQVFTAPIVWLKFGTFPKYFLITNLTATPLTSIVMFSSIALIAASALGLPSGILLKINEASVQALLKLLEIISAAAAS